MDVKELKKDIEVLKEIHQRLEENYDDDEWDLSEHEYVELSKITGYDDHDWDDGSLAHFIDGMQRTLHLLEIYND